MRYYPVDLEMKIYLRRIISSWEQHNDRLNHPSDVRNVCDFVEDYYNENFLKTEIFDVKEQSDA